MTDTPKPCRSTGPAGEKCVRKRGHPGSEFTRENHRESGNKLGAAQWDGGIKTAAVYKRPPSPPDYSEAAFQLHRSHGVSL